MTWQKSVDQFHAWAAGAFEAGGHLSPSRVSLTTRDGEIAKDLQRFFGGRIVRTAPTAWSWGIPTQDERLRFLRAIVPYTHPKRQQEIRNILVENV